MLLIASCGDSGAPAEGELKPRAPPPAVAPKMLEPANPERITVHSGAALRKLDVSRAESIDLAVSPIDLVGYLDDADADRACDGVDLVELASRAPNLARLRVSGCPVAIRSGLASFADRLESLELADVELDGVTIGRISQLYGLQELTLVRVKLGTEPLTPLRKLSLRRVSLSELERDSDIAALLGEFPHSLEHVELAGSWAGHDAMISLSKAEGLRSLVLRDTRIGNFSLNQIKPLARLTDLELRGSTFNDNSVLYMRELPVRRFVCACPRLGDQGLRNLRHAATVTALALPDSQVTGPGLAELEALQKLSELSIENRDIGPEGFEALARVTTLRRLELTGEVEDGQLTNLSGLRGLRALRLACPNVGDKIAGELGKLTELQELDLSRTQFSDVGLAALRRMDQLRVLKLHHTRVTNRGLSNIGGLAKLTHLELDHTDVVDAGVAHLKQLQNLEELRLNSTLVTDAAIEHLVGLDKLNRLNLSDTVVTAEGASKLSQLKSLEVLGLAGTRI